MLLPMLRVQAQVPPALAMAGMRSALQRWQRGSELNGSLESLLNRLNREVSMSTVDNLEESNLWVTSQVNILGTISYELHKSASHV